MYVLDSIKIILLGIAIILFGLTIAVISTGEVQSIAFYINLVGLIIVIGGFFKVRK